MTRENPIRQRSIHARRKRGESWVAETESLDESVDTFDADRGQQDGHQVERVAQDAGGLHRDL